MTPMPERDPIHDFDMINNELAAYDERLAGRPQLVALNKTDMVEETVTRRTIDELESRGFRVFPICAPIHEGTDILMQAVAAELARLPATRLLDETTESMLYQYAPEELFKIRHDEDVYRVEGTWIDNLVQSTNFEDHDSLQYFQRLIRKKGVIHALEQAGVREGDLVALSDVEFEFIP